MLKNRLYYENPYCKKFKSTILSASEDKDGNPYIVLENTAFYPTGGGQPHDTGTLNGISVVNVEEVNGEIRHFINEKINSTEEVEGIINWERRFDHMQQHAGQHILSATFAKLFEFETVSFHLGKDIASIDLDTPNITDEQLEKVEKMANEVILENRTVQTKWITESELEKFPLRKKVAVNDEIRLVIIPDFDYNGCGGTHPSTTREVSSIKILSIEKTRGQTRVYFVCGQRVLHQLQRKTTVLANASRLLSASEEAVNTAIEKLLAANHLLEKSLKKKEESLLSFEVKELLTTQKDDVVKTTFTDKTVKHLQKIAKLLLAESDELIVLLVTENENKLQFVAACGAHVKISMKQISSVVLPLINGKGGGSDAIAQGGGELEISAEHLLQVMANTLNEERNT